jgi:hypothetical protein
MRTNTLIHSAMFVLLAGGASACSDAATAPDAPSSLSSDLTGSTASASGPTGAATVVDTAQRLRCRADNELTEREIARIRALYHAYLDAIAPYRALIDKVNQEAREAAQHGATREEIAKILARADEAKETIAALTRRLRSAIHDILFDDRLPCFVVAVPSAALSDK